MGQKVHPIGYRIGVIRGWESKWYASGKNYVKNLHEDIKLREWVKKRCENASISRVEIERVGKVIRFTIWTARPGLIIGKQGAELVKIKEELQALTGSRVMLNVQEIKNPDVDALLVAESIASALERRVSFRRAMKQAMSRTMRANAKGIKASCGGRLGGAEIARKESYTDGTIPLQTLRADIDYGFAEANTAYGKVGVKTWINHGEVLPAKGNKEGGNR